MEKRVNIAIWLLRLGVAFVFLFAASSAYLNPINWVGFFPLIIQDNVPIPIETMLLVFLIFESILALWILSGWKSFYSSIIATLVILPITILNPHQFIILFRDVAIALAALALAVLTWGK